MLLEFECERHITYSRIICMLGKKTEFRTQNCACACPIQTGMGGAISERRTDAQLRMWFFFFKNLDHYIL